MNSKLAILTGCITLALVACSGAEDDASPAGSAPCTTSAADPTVDSTDLETDDEPAADAAAAPDAGGMKKTPSPVEVCEGLYSCGLCGSGEEKFWLHSDGDRCIFGDDDDGIVLHPDGGVTSGAGKSGSWSGDEAYFTLKYPDVCYTPGTGGPPSSWITCRREQ